MTGLGGFDQTLDVDVCPWITRANIKMFAKIPFFCYFQVFAENFVRPRYFVMGQKGS
ncbi:hypothetical protein [Sedimentitalea nanhaiensis]|uniref:Uncharacterized protein n=1 Tax=Sedimentitalea nanhaiensis TaxID=999627 RepID=A0A1I7CF07_9RHOB|nr:hypothetical protein [Sedimentitalea nanhaiensis]SFT98007.1 hypothetical protein SAMN05216236_11651 [Sedimentitalea nanhaiensis]